MDATSVLSLILGVDYFALDDIRRPFLGDQRKRRIWFAARAEGEEEIARVRFVSLSQAN